MSQTSLFDRRHRVHEMRDTSMESYATLPNKETKERIVYDCILENSNRGVFLTDREIAVVLHYSDPNKVRPRRHALMKAKLIVEAGRRKCHITQKNKDCFSSPKSILKSPIFSMNQDL